MKGTIMLESGLVEVAVVQVDGADARVRDDDGEEYWVTLADIELQVQRLPHRWNMALGHGVADLFS